MDFCITVFNGFVSGLYFYPGFISGRTPHSYGGPALYTDGYLIDAEEFYLRNIAAAVWESPNFIGFDLGNELTTTMGKGAGHITDEKGKRLNDAWAERMYALCEELVPGRLLTNGIDHQPWIYHRDFTCDGLANSGNITALHCYSKFLGMDERFGLLSEESLHVAPFMTELAKAHCSDPSRRYWIQEFGTCSSETMTDEMAAFVEQSIKAMYTSENLWGITWWCTNNIPRGYTSFQPLEYRLGLLDSDNKPTPSGLLFQKLVREYKANPAAPVRRDSAFVLKIDEASTGPRSLKAGHGVLAGASAVCRGDRGNYQYRVSDSDAARNRRPYRRGLAGRTCASLLQ